MKKIALIFALLFVAAPAFAASITLTVTPGAGATSHNIQRSVNGGAFTALVSLPMPTVTYEDTAVTAPNTYAYRVISQLGTALSVPSAPCTSSLITVSPSSVSCTINPN